MFWWKLSLAELLTIKPCFSWPPARTLIARVSVFVYLFVGAYVCVREKKKKNEKKRDSFEIPENDSRGSERSDHSRSLLRSDLLALGPITALS